MSFRFELRGNAFQVLTEVARTGRAAIMRAVKKAAHTVQARAKINVHQKLNTTGQSKGYLSRSIAVLAHPGRLQAEIGPSAVYGRIHELGGVIVPVRAEYLWFKVANRWVRTKKVTIPARPYLQPALDDSEPEIKALFEHEVGNLFRGGR